MSHPSLTPAQEALLRQTLKDPSLLKHVLKQGLLRQPIAKTALEQFVTVDPDMVTLKAKVVKLAPAKIPVLLVGETGTGKELLARSLHECSQRKGPFIPVNCAAISETLLEAELFGALKGSYTGCHADRKGYFESATDGTLFLDEISELPLGMQTKLLRVLENKTIRRVGDTTERPVNCRIVAATNILHLEQNKFRRDIYYRLAGSVLRTKPLRERRRDIQPITVSLDGDSLIPEGLIQTWTLDETNYPFLGNIRELRNLIEEYIALL